MTFVDEFNRPLPGGTVLKDPCSLHEGIVAYALPAGQQVILHKSPRLGRPAMTEPTQFVDGNCRLVRKKVPQSPAQANVVVQRAFAEVQSGGTPWTLWDNCEDFVSRAYTGQGGSETRNFALCLLAAVSLLAFAFGRSS
jgi:hypothetical protein